MSRHFFQYWKPDTVDYNLTNTSILDHSGSDQLNRVKPDDTVWIVTVRKGELFLVGRIQVGQCTDLNGAKQYLNTNDVWDAKHHIIAKSGTAEPLRLISLASLASKLRFKSAKSDRLAVVNGKVNAQQLQTLRLLTPASTRLVEAKWKSSGASKSKTTKSGRKPSIAETSVAIDIEAPPPRIEVTTTRIIRDTEKTKQLKEKYDYQCQVCGERIEIGKNKFYAEVHHIRPLGGHHKGVDSESNMIVLCPNHHAMFDLRIPLFLSTQEIKIGSDHFKLLCKHTLDKSVTEYHNDQRRAKNE